MSSRVRPGVGDGGQAGLDREIDVGAAEPPPDVGLSDARNDGPALQGLLDRAHDASAGVKSGIQTSSWCSKTTRTGWPIRTSSGSTSTRLA